MAAPAPAPLVFGVLALQGGFLEHVSHLRRLGLRAERVLSVRTPQQLARKRTAELKNGRLAMIGVMSFVSAHYIPDSVPLLPLRV
jgi:hypothetical protein